MDHTAQSMILRGVASVGVLTIWFHLTHELLGGCVGLTLVTVATLLLFDVQKAKHLQKCYSRLYELVRMRRLWRDITNRRRFQRLRGLFRFSFPLGLTTTLAAINLNMPRYFISAEMGEHRLGIFSALAYSTVALTLVCDSLGHCAIPRLARLYAGSQMPQFRLSVLRLGAAGIGFGFIALMLTRLAGKQLLVYMYNAEYSRSAAVFMVLMLGAAIHCVASLLSVGIVAARCFVVQIPIYIAMTAATALACSRLVPRDGLLGGAEAVVIGAVLRLVLTGGVLAHLWKWSLHIGTLNQERQCCGTF
jgi:O-antigen/teichoic acid export membrane protein